MFLILVSCAQAQQSVLFPLMFSETCWSNVTLQNVSDADADVRLTAHKSTGALVPLTGAPSSRLMLAAGAKIRFRLQVEGEEDRQAWVQMSERGPPSIALSGAVECLDPNGLKAVASSVLFPARNPWIRGDVADFQAGEVWMLNASAAAASASLCYSNGSYTQLPDGAKPTEICADEEELFLPPFGMRTAPIVKNGNTRFSLRATGEAVALRLVITGTEKQKQFSVDSTIQYSGVPAALNERPQR